MYQFVIVEDNDEACELLKMKMNNFSEYYCVNTFTSLRNIDPDYIKNNNIDLIFLDVELQEENAMDFLKFNKLQVQIIIYTGFPNYAVSAFEEQVLDFLVKPVTNQRLSKSLNKFEKLYDIIQKSEITTNVEYIQFKNYSKIQVYKKCDLIYVKANGNYMQYYFTTGYAVEKITMKEVLQIENIQLIQIHKSYAVNVNFIKEFTSSDIRLKTEDSRMLPLGRTYKIIFKNEITKYFNTKLKTDA
ncbi:MAG: LytR/AlgR family response regulator transcription factor [Flavobacteriales bacterium]